MCTVRLPDKNLLVEELRFCARTVDVLEGETAVVLEERRRGRDDTATTRCVWRR